MACHVSFHLVIPLGAILASLLLLSESSRHSSLKSPKLLDRRLLASAWISLVVAELLTLLVSMVACLRLDRPNSLYLKKLGLKSCIPKIWRDRPVDEHHLERREVGLAPLAALARRRAHPLAPRLRQGVGVE